MSIKIVISLIICLVYGHPQSKPVLPSKDGYAIMPVKWAKVDCKNDELQYEIKGNERQCRLPFHIRKKLQSEYENITKPSKKATTEDLKTIMGPLNLIKEKKHTLWVFPFQYRSIGHAVIFIQHLDGTFVKGSYTIALNSSK